MFLDINDAAIAPMIIHFHWYTMISLLLHRFYTRMHRSGTTYFFVDETLTHSEHFARPRSRPESPCLPFASPNMDMYRRFPLTFVNHGLRKAFVAEERTYRHWPDSLTNRYSSFERPLQFSNATAKYRSNVVVDSLNQTWKSFLASRGATTRWHNFFDIETADCVRLFNISLRTLHLRSDSRVPQIRWRVTRFCRFFLEKRGETKRNSEHGTLKRTPFRRIGWKKTCTRYRITHGREKPKYNEPQIYKIASNNPGLTMASILAQLTVVPRTDSSVFR